MMRFFLALFFVSSLLFAQSEAITQIEALDKKNKELFAQVKLFIDELVEKEKKELEHLNLDADASVKQLQNGLEKAYRVATLYGLETQKMQKLYELSKKVILNMDFETHDSLQAPTTANTFANWFDLTKSRYAKIQEEKAAAQEQRVAFYKKVTLQYINALTQKDASLAYEEFAKYVNALRTIQSADAGHLIAQAELLVAEQKLVADLSSAIPLVGEALDIIAITTGEDLSGQKLSNFEKGFTLVALLTPEILTQVIKRNPAIGASFGKMSAKLETLSDEALTKISKKYRSKKALKAHLDSLSGPSDEVLRWREFYRQKALEKQKLSALDRSLKSSMANDAEKSLRTTFTRQNPLGDEMGEKILQTAQKRGEVIITRPTSPDLPTRLNEGAYTKGMNVKGKSADSGIASGYVPKNQSFSKLKESTEISSFQKKVNDSLQKEVIKVDGVEHIITPQQVQSRQLIVQRGDEILEAVEIPKKSSNDSIAVFQRSDGKFVDESYKQLSEDLLQELELTKAKPFEVLTDMDGNYLTADIDLLAIGSKRGEMIVQNDALMGNINANEMATVDELNRALKTDNFPDRQLVHHGGENRFMSASSQLDFPLTAYSPDGKVAIIYSETELKKYFHMQKLKGFDLDPNPFWGWGEFDPVHGYQ